ncbi:MAG: hypothetical protein Q8K63_05745 [Acidimicrobiales bacterium]|nr:hypothetical protein [Acidimicrobiales bacterium]
MRGENRVISTDLLCRHADASTASLVISGGLLRRLDNDAMHILVTNGRTNGNGFLICDALLDVGRDTPARVPIFVGGELFQTLPTAFQVIAATSRLMPNLFDGVNGVPDHTLVDDDLWAHLLAAADQDDEPTDDDLLEEMLEDES